MPIRYRYANDPPKDGSRVVAQIKNEPVEHPMLYKDGEWWYADGLTKPFNKVLFWKDCTKD